jgi:hypothetical protein
VAPGGKCLNCGWESNWQQQQHFDAVAEFKERRPYICCPETLDTSNPSCRRWESALLQILNGMELYAKTYATQYEDQIGSDGLFRPIFEDMVDGFRQLLNGEMGRLDGAEMSTMLRNFSKENNLSEYFG